MAKLRSPRAYDTTGAVSIFKGAKLAADPTELQAAWEKAAWDLIRAVATAADEAGFSVTDRDTIPRIAVPGSKSDFVRLSPWASFEVPVHIERFRRDGFLPPTAPRLRFDPSTCTFFGPDPDQENAAAFVARAVAKALGEP